MEPWVIYAVLGTWLTVKGWLRWKRSVRDALSSRPYSLSSPPTDPKPTWRALDPDRTLHEAYCGSCDTKPYVPLRTSRLEARPWRLTWRCPVCGAQAVAKVADEVLPSLLALDRAGGMAVSKREVERFAAADAADFEASVLTELL
jgi:hypothetical protein